MSFIPKVITTDSIIVEKSKFIAIIAPLNSENVNELLNETRKQYKDARHVTFAYRYNNSEKASDDGEPQNTAGLPLLNLLKMNDFNNTILIVVRYFGGKKLGAGRLLRTYVEAGMKVINMTQKCVEIPAYLYEIELARDEYERVRNHLEKNRCLIQNIDFSHINVHLQVIVSKDDTHLVESNYNIKSKIDSILLKEVFDE